MNNRYGIYDTRTGKLVEGGFFQHGAAADCSDDWNANDLADRVKAGEVIGTDYQPRYEARPQARS